MKSFSLYGGFHFNADVFFYVVLPPIIFHQGYSLKKRKFFQYFSLIISFGVLGTLLQFVVITLIAYHVTRQNWFPLPFALTIHESMLMGALFSSADEVATLSVIKQDKYPKLSAVLFGEGVLNDAVSILLFQMVQESSTASTVAEEASPTSEILLSMLRLIGKSIYVLFLSGIIGLVSGLCVAACFKYMPSFQRHPDKQTAILMLGGYFSFSMSEVFDLSGILSVFFCGVSLSHYAWHSLSDAAQITSKLTSESMALICEAYCFAAIGLSVPEFDLDQWSFWFIGLMLLSLMIARAASTYGIIVTGEFFNVHAFRIPMAEQHVIYFGGLVRASISWALVVQIAQESNGLFVTSTLGVILITVVVFSSVIRLFTTRLEPEVQSPGRDGNPKIPKTFFFDENYETIPINRCRSVSIDGSTQFYHFESPRRAIRTSNPGSRQSTPRKASTTAEIRAALYGLNSHREKEDGQKHHRKDISLSSFHKDRSTESFHSRSSHWHILPMRYLWNRFDNKFLKPIFGGAPHPMESPYGESIDWLVEDELIPLSPQLCSGTQIRDELPRNSTGPHPRIHHNSSSTSYGSTS